MSDPRSKSQSEHRRCYGATDGVDREADPADGALSPHSIEPATVLVDIKAWPSNVSVFGKVGATASLDIHCARRRLSRASRGRSQRLTQWFTCPSVVKS